MEIINLNKLFEAQRLLEDVYIVDEGEVQQIKYINYETFSAKQAKKKKINKYQLSSTKKIKYDKPFYTLNLSAIIETEKTTILTKKDTA
jgi:hypothetical protein